MSAARARDSAIAESAHSPRDRERPCRPRWRAFGRCRSLADQRIAPETGRPRATRHGALQPWHWRRSQKTAPWPRPWSVRALLVLRPVSDLGQVSWPRETTHMATVRKNGTPWRKDVREPPRLRVPRVARGASCNARCPLQLTPRATAGSSSDHHAACTGGGQAPRACQAARPQKMVHASDQPPSPYWQTVPRAVSRAPSALRSTLLPASPARRRPWPHGGSHASALARRRWYNCLDPDLNKDPFTRKEEEDLLKAHGWTSLPA